MANRDLGIPVLVVYLLSWWGGLAALLAFVTSNTAPLAPELKWETEEVLTTTKIAVDIATPSIDADGDKVEYAYAWTHNGVPMEGKGGRSISSKETIKGDVWEVTVTPDDGTFESWGCNLPWRQCAGGVSTSLSVTVGNSPPRPRLRFQNTEGADLEEYDKKGQDIVLKLSCFDPDFIDLDRREKEEMKARGEEPPPPPEPVEGQPAPEPEDPCTYTINWWPNDPVPEGEEAPVLEEGAVSEYQDRILPKDVVKTHQGWKVVVVANDGEADGEAVEDELRVIAE